MEDNRLLAYEAPQVITYTDAEILEELGQAHAYGRPGNGPGKGPGPGNGHGHGHGHG
jgi:hypothetical protein